jgi:predicted dehydrogenase
VHANAWRQVGRFFDLTTEPDLKIACGREGQAAEKAAQKLGFREHATSWNGVVRWPGIDVVDAVLRLVRFEGGAIGSIEGSGFCPGRKNHNRFEINRSKGSLVFDLERMNELEAYQEAGPDGGFRTVLATDETPIPSWRPGGPRATDSAMSTLLHTWSSTSCAMESGTAPKPSFQDGVVNQRVLDAVERSSRSRRWEAV